jgi:hypothetical protein
MLERERQEKEGLKLDLEARRVQDVGDQSLDQLAPQLRVPAMGTQLWNGDGRGASWNSKVI